MNPKKRIAELEQEVRQLRGRVRELEAQVPEAPYHHGLVEEMRERVDHAFHGHTGEEIEAELGTVWLNRLAVVVVMTAFALAARATFQTVELEAWQKVALGYTSAAAFLIFGLAYRRTSDLFSEAMAGCGFATLYFTTFAAFFIAPMQLGPVAGSPLAIPALLVCLLLLAGAAQWRRSPTMAGVGLFLAYYTVLISSTGEATLTELIYALVASMGLALVALAFYVRNQWTLFSWGALLATYGTFYFHLYARSARFSLDDPAYFWVCTGFLTGCYLLFATGFLIDAFQREEFRERVAPIAALNSFFYCAFVWYAAGRAYPESALVLRAALVGLLAALALASRVAGPQRNYLYQLFITKAVLIAALTAAAALSGTALLLTLATASLLLGVAWRVHGLAAFKVLSLLLLVAAFVATMASLRLHGEVTVAGYAVPANWFAALGVALICLVSAWFYARMAPSAGAAHASESHLLLGESMLNVSPHLMAMAYSVCAAIIVLSITVVQRGDDLMLPYLLAAEGLALAALGFLLRTHQVDVASVLLLSAAHAIYYVFAYLPIEGFVTQPFYANFTLALAFVTLVSAVLWERYVNSFSPTHDWDHHLLVALPGLAATLMAALLLQQYLDDAQTPAAIGLLGAVLLGGGLAAGYSGVQAGGFLGAGLATFFFFRGLYDGDTPLATAPGFLPYFIGFLATLTLAERAMALFRRDQPVASRLRDGARTLLVLVITGAGIAGLYAWAPHHHVIFALLGLGAATMVIGFIFREHRYRWAALAILALTLVRAFVYFGSLDPALQVLSFGASGAVLLGVSYFYARRTAFTARRKGELPRE